MVLAVAALPHFLLRVHDALDRALFVVLEDHALGNKVLEPLSAVSSVGHTAMGRIRHIGSAESASTGLG